MHQNGDAAGAPKHHVGVIILQYHVMNFIKIVVVISCEVGHVCFFEYVCECVEDA